MRNTYWRNNKDDETQSFRKIYLSLFLKGLCVRRSWRPNRIAIYWPPLLWPSALCLSRSPGLLNQRPGGPLWWVQASSTASCHQRVWSPNYWLPVFIELYNSSMAHSISPHNCHRNVSLPPSLEWYVWLSSSGNNCHAVLRSLSSGASVYDCTAGFYLVPFCQPSSPTPMEYALQPSLEWHVWPGRMSIYNIYRKQKKNVFRKARHFFLQKWLLTKKK